MLILITLLRGQPIRAPALSSCPLFHASLKKEASNFADLLFLSNLLISILYHPHLALCWSLLRSFPFRLFPLLPSSSALLLIFPSLSIYSALV